MLFNKSFVKLGIVYAAGEILSKILSYMLLPIYTNQLGSSGFGQLALVDTVLEFLSTFAICSIYSGYFRFYREYKGKDRLMLKNTAINFALISSFVYFIFTLAAGKFISNLIFKFDNSYQIFVLIAIRNILTQFTFLFMCDYKLNYQALITVTLNFTNLCLNLLLSIYFVVYKKEGIIGVYKGYILSSAIVLLYLIIVNIRSYRPRINKSMLKNMLKFSLGLIPGNISGTILTLSDRYFLSGYRSYSETGVYSIGYKFGMLIETLFISPFKSIFTPYKFEIWKDDGAKNKFIDIFNEYHFLGLFVMLGIAIYSRTAIKLISTNEFSNAYKIVPLVLFSYFIYGKSCFYSFGIQLKNKTYIDGIIMICGSIINIILNFILIPGLGMYGAALSTCLSYSLMNIIYIWIALPMYFVEYDFKRTFANYIISIFIYGIYYLISIYNFPLFIEFISGLFLLALYLYISLLFKLTDRETIMKYINIIMVKFKVRRPEAEITKNNIEVLTFDINSATELSLIRNIGEAGFNITFLYYQNKGITRFSKYITKKLRISSWKLHSDMFIKDLIKIGKNNPMKYMIISANDFINTKIADNYAELKKYYYLTFNNSEIINLMINKKTFYIKMKEFNINMPETFFIKEKYEVDSIVQNTGYPFIVKPYLMDDIDFRKSFENKILKIHDEIEYIKYREDLIKIYDKILIQKVVNGSNAAVYGYFYNGNFISSCEILKDYMDKYGTTIIGHSKNMPLLRNYSKQILNRLGYEGFAELEYIFDEKNSDYKLIEINTRPVQWCRLCKYAAAFVEDIPLKYLKNEELYLSYNIKNNVYIYNEIGMLELFREKIITFNQMLELVNNKNAVSMFYDKKDLAPSLIYRFYFYAKIIKGLIR